MPTEVRSLNEECGIFGVWGHSEASHVTYFGLHNLQHRGQEGAGIVSNEEGYLRGYRGLGLLSEVFADEKKINKLKALNIKNETFNIGVSELEKVINNLKK